MNDPQRLIDDGSPVTRAICHAARADRAPAKLEARTMRAVGLGAATLGLASAAAVTASVAPAKAATSAVTPLTVAALGKWLGVGLVAGIGVIGTVDTVGHARRGSPEVAPATPGEARGIGRATRGRTITASSSASTPRESAALDLPPLDLPPLGAPASRPTPRAIDEEAPSPPLPAREETAIADAASRLLAETRLVDSARAALTRGAAATVDRLLARHAAEFPRGELRAEVAFLRVEVRRARGDAAGAAAAASALLREHPAAPQAVRARAVLEQRARGSSDPSPLGTAWTEQDRNAR